MKNDDNKLISQANYDLFALSTFIENVPYLQLKSSDYFEEYVAKMATDIIELEDILNQYPNVLYQPLDEVYLLMRYVASINTEIISDLLTYFNWRGVVIASWLILFAPKKEYLQLLQTIENQYEFNDWLVKIAIAEIQGEKIANQKLQTDIKIIREAIIDKLPTPIQFPTANNSLFAKRDEIYAYFKKHGTNKTIEYINRLKADL